MQFDVSIAELTSWRKNKLARLCRWRRLFLRPSAEFCQIERTAPTKVDVKWRRSFYHLLLEFVYYTFIPRNNFARASSYRGSLTRQRLQNGNNLMSHEGIQTGCWLVAEHQRRIGQYFRSERQSLHLTARKTLHFTGYPYRGVSAFRKGELLTKDWIDGIYSKYS